MDGFFFVARCSVFLVLIFFCGCCSSEIIWLSTFRGSHVVRAKDQENLEFLIEAFICRSFSYILPPLGRVIFVPFPTKTSESSCFDLQLFFRVDCHMKIII